MRVRIKSYNGELVDYLSVGKEYAITEVLYDNLFSIEADDGGYLVVYTLNCDHLNGGEWELLNDITNNS